ncbi:protein ATP12, mitochondrial [Ceratobasidium sp. AG-Ba]|nr:protein ATP12, mitochondrial [Ceratobasidium sp. AG-Ba]QRW14699.1 protein ATP12, mitochondrial [Ceratobasidium sp. AG-Ba]
MFRASRFALSVRVLTRSPLNTKASINLYRSQSNAAAVLAPKTEASASANSMNRAGVTLKRFWKTVDVAEKDGILTVTLDGRPLRTPGGAKLEIPSSHRMLATLIATEWENQEKLIKPHALPITSIASRAIDNLKDEGARIDLAASLLKYLDTDTICFYETHPPVLVKLQEEHWTPLIDWARETYQAEINTFDSILGNSQPAETKAIFAAAVDNFNQWEMAAFERAVLSTKSFIIGLAFVKGQITAEKAAQAAHVEVSSQIERWGEVEDTHDVDYHDIRRQLGSVACLLATN